jgi:hypothetical protein
MRRDALEAALTDRPAGIGERPLLAVRSGYCTCTDAR